MIKRINSLLELEQIAIELAKQCQKDMYILLSGELGAGKTTFSKLLLNALGVKENVTSPTFVIMNSYQGSLLNINHVDAYRLNLTNDVEEFEEQFSQSLNVIEWFENMNIDFKKTKYIKLVFKIIDDNTREIFIEQGE